MLPLPPGDADAPVCAANVDVILGGGRHGDDLICHLQQVLQGTFRRDKSVWCLAKWAAFFFWF